MSLSGSVERGKHVVIQHIFLKPYRVYVPDILPAFDNPTIKKKRDKVPAFIVLTFWWEEMESKQISIPIT